MAYKSLQHFIEVLQKNNEILEIDRFINPELEITELTDRISKKEGGGEAILIKDSGTDFPVLMNAFGSYKRMCLSLGVESLDDIGKDITGLLKAMSAGGQSFVEKLKLLPKLKQLSSWMPKLKKGKAVCQEVVHREPDLSILPVLKCWPNDGGRFVTLPMVHTVDPHTGIRNVGMYRMQIFSKNTTGMHWHRHKVGARHYQEYKKLGKRMPVAVALGGDPAYTYTATAPLPDNIDEYMFAGFLRKKRVELTKCLTQDIEVPADADIIIEGYIETHENFVIEGPFGDHTGFYSLPDYYPVFHVTCITHRKDAVYPATIVGIPPQEDAYLAKATERIFLTPIKMTILPEMQDMDMPVEGVAHNITIAKIEKTYPGQALKVMNALWGAGQMMFNKILLVADGDTDIADYKALAQQISERVVPELNIHKSSGPLDVLDHSASKMAFGGKLCIDTTETHPEEQFETTSYNIEKVDFDPSKLKRKFTEIDTINQTLLKQKISLVIISYKKSKTKHTVELAQKLLTQAAFHEIKFFVFVDSPVDVMNVSQVAWITANNIEPIRDCHVLFSESGKSHLIIDGTRKTEQHDSFKRDWPNVIVSNDETIKHIDEIWDDLKIGELIASPSLKYKPLVVGDKAEV